MALYVLFIICSIKDEEKAFEKRNQEKCKFEKGKFHSSKQTIDINNLSIDKIMISNKNYSSKKGFKYSIGYEDDKKVRPSCIMHAKVSQQSILCPE